MSAQELFRHNMEGEELTSWQKFRIEYWALLYFDPDWAITIVVIIITILGGYYAVG
jgi:hypothetical protein